MIFLSSNHFSVDDQISDVVSYLSNHADYATLMDTDFLAAFPEYNTLEWSGSWVDTENSGVDVEFMSWVCDWLEDKTPVYWRDGEPVIPEDDDPEEDES